ncbi:MAG: c-type cytochrome domain-containing protein [Aureliella sp.]
MPWFNRSRPHSLRLTLILAIALMPSAATSGQESETKQLIDFNKHVQPILESKCLECHGPDDAKNDYRVDDEDSLLGYLEPGDLESSSMWVDYMIAEDEDMHMPPLDKPQLTGPELATIKLWIEEGAIWTGWQSDEVAADPEPETVIAEKPFFDRVMMFQGLFHPASVHFPIALLAISTLFLVGSFIWREAFESAAFHCLWIGGLGAAAACVMGWGYAQHEGYGAAGFDLQNSSIDRHRWLGIAVAVGAFVLIPMAQKARSKSDKGMRFLWLIGSVALMLGVSITGYQGGELTYGEDHYEKEFNRLFPAANMNPSDDTASDSSEEADAGESAES